MRTLTDQLVPIATDLAAAPRVYVDANVPAGVVSFMRTELGWDVLFVLEDDQLRRAPDEEHFRLALEFGRTLITLDYDFWDERRFPLASSPGVIVCSAPDEPGLMRLLRHADRSLLRPPVPAALPLRGQKIELTPWVFAGSGSSPND
jgi:predicted nuclease of predicted toxin-antitoxin system